MINSIPIALIKSYNLSGLTWASLFGTRILLSQLNQKFQVLWDPAVTSLSQVINGFVKSNERVNVDVDRSSDDEAGIGTYFHSMGKSNKRSRATIQNDEKDCAEEQDGMRKRKKRRRLQSSLTRLHEWLWSELRKEIYMACHDCDSGGQQGTKPSLLYEKAKRRIRGRFHGVGVDQLENRVGDFGAVYDKTKLEEFWMTSSSALIDCTTYRQALNFSVIRRTDGLTRHQYSWKVLASIVNSCSSINIMQLTSAATQDNVDVIMVQEWVSWMLKWSLATALSVCEGDVIEEDNDKNNINSNIIGAMQKLLIKSKRGRGDRFGDAIRGLLSMHHIVKLGLIKSTNNEDTTPLLSDWNNLVEICKNRVLILPEKNLQNLCLQV